MIQRADLKNWLRALGGSPRRPAQSHSAAPGLETLEDRLVPSGVPTVDLTTRGAIGSVNGAIFQQADPQPTGTGVIRSFVRLQTPNGKATVEQGYNTDARPLQFDENKSPQFTRSLQLSDLPTVDIGGVTYREILLDVNQKSSQPYLSLDELRLYAGSQPNLTGYDATTQALAGLAPVYDMGAGNWVKLDYRLDNGSGSGDMVLYVPDASFGPAGGNPYVYLYSKFGVNFAGNSGFEEWAPGAAGVAPANGTISGTVTQTSSLSGTSPLADQIVFIDTNGDGILDGNEVYTITDANGHYSFNDLATGLGSYSTYRVTVQPPYDVTQYVTPPVSPYYTPIQLQNTNQTVSNVDFSINLDNWYQPPSS